MGHLVTMAIRCLVTRLIYGSLIGHILRDTEVFLLVGKYWNCAFNYILTMSNVHHQSY